MSFVERNANVTAACGKETVRLCPTQVVRRRWLERPIADQPRNRPLTVSMSFVLPLIDGGGDVDGGRPPRLSGLTAARTALEQHRVRDAQRRDRCVGVEANGAESSRLLEKPSAVKTI